MILQRCRLPVPSTIQMFEILVKSRGMVFSHTKTPHLTTIPCWHYSNYSSRDNNKIGQFRTLSHVHNRAAISSSATLWLRVPEAQSKADISLKLNQESTTTTDIGAQTIPQKIVEACPLKWQPYLRLSRVHQPIGTWLLFWPCTWGLGLATGGLPDLSLLALFGTGAFIMRGAGCTVNDMWDRHIDKKVRRTSDRPLASGELRMRHAAGWLLFQLSLAFSILLQLNQPCFIIGVGSLVLVTVYPLAKRVTHWPQAVLGSTFNVGVLMGYTAALKYNHLGYLTFPWLDPSCLSMYLAGISWTLIYDTIYAHQDREDDAQLGLGSTARRFGDNTKNWLTGFSCLTIGGLTTCGILESMLWPFYAGVASVAAHFVWQIKTLDINNHQNCSERFKSNRHIGWLVFLGIIGSGVYSKYEKNSNAEINLVSSISTQISNDSISLLKMNPSPASSVTTYPSRIELKNS